MTDGIDAYPLQWPAGRPRNKVRRNARFKRTQDRARRDLCSEVRMAGGTSLVISTNCELRRDGLPRSDRRPPDDPGVAAYFVDRNKRLTCVACDRWDTVKDNMTAVASMIEAMRGIERWGGQQASDQAFAGFAALPPAVKDRTGQPWHVVFNVAAHAPSDEVESAYRTLAKQRHPDRGGSEQGMRDLNDAYSQFRTERGLAP